MSAETQFENLEGRRMFEMSLIEGVNLIEGGDLGDLAGGDWGLDPGPPALPAFGVLPSEALGMPALGTPELRMPDPPPSPPPFPSEGIKWMDIFLLISIFVGVGGVLLYFETREPKEKK